MNESTLATEAISSVTERIRLRYPGTYAHLDETPMPRLDMNGCDITTHEYISYLNTIYILLIRTECWAVRRTISE